jgi:tetratricopeptide (TPR) repeat protein
MNHEKHGAGRADVCPAARRAFRAYASRMATQSVDAVDAARWDAVEEATELMNDGRVVVALGALRNVIKADPRNPYAFHFLGAALFETGEHEAARDAYRAALRLAPNHLGARVALSHLLRQLGDLDGALSQANEALRRFPGDGEAMQAAGLAYAAKGNKKAAKKQLEGFLRSNPELETRLEVEQILSMLGIAGENEPVEFD